MQRADANDKFRFRINAETATARRRRQRCVGHLLMTPTPRAAKVALDLETEYNALPYGFNPVVFVYKNVYGCPTRKLIFVHQGKGSNNDCISARYLSRGGAV